jgi:hypothetical protein
MLTWDSVYFQEVWKNCSFLNKRKLYCSLGFYSWKEESKDEKVTAFKKAAKKPRKMEVDGEMMEYIQLCVGMTKCWVS